MAPGYRIVTKGIVTTHEYIFKMAHDGACSDGPILQYLLAGTRYKSERPSWIHNLSNFIRTLVVDRGIVLSRSSNAASALDETAEECAAGRDVYTMGCRSTHD